jgi:hypothetical protein
LTSSDDLNILHFMTAKEAIIKLGRQRVIVTLGISTAQVSNCISSGLFPAHWFNSMDKMAATDGWEIPRDLFSWKRNDAA